MGLRYITAAAWIVGMLFAPDNLILLGQSAGRHGVGFIFLLFCAMLAYIAHSKCYKDIAAFRPGTTGEFEWIAHSLNPVVAVIFSIAPRILSALFLATAALVAAGFVFNEVFLQRFPNFAFAFIMLGTLLAITLFRPEMSKKIQVLLSGTAAIGIFILAVAGIFACFKTCEAVYSVPFLPSVKGSAAVLLLFVGFDLLIFIPKQYSLDSLFLHRYLIIGLLVAGLLFCFWGAASFLFVPAERLANTYIPHILAAKSILGNPGRVIMGLVIITGAGAAVNALFLAVSGVMANLIPNASLPVLSRFFSRSQIVMIFMTLVTAIMMALGVAGTDELDTYIRGSLILWLLNYTVIHLIFILGGAERSQKVKAPLSRRKILNHAAIFMLMLTGSAMLIVTDENVELLIRYLSIILVGIGLPTWLVGRWQSRYRTNHVRDGS